MEHSEDSSTPREAWNVPVASLPFARLATSGTGPGERYGHTAVLCVGKMYVFGGCDVGGRFMNDLFALDVERGVWEAIGNESGGEWPMARHFHGAVTVGSCFYVLFGKSNGYMNDVHRFDPAARRWDKIDSENSAPSRRYGHTVVEWGGDIYVFGGFDDFGLRCNDLWRFDCERREWSAVQHLQSEAPDALHHAAVVHQGSMLVWSGIEAGNDVFEFRFGSRSWSKGEDGLLFLCYSVLTTLAVSFWCPDTVSLFAVSKVQVRSPASARPRPKWGHRCFCWEDSLYVVGGTDAVMGHSTVWRFSLTSYEWTLLGEAEGLSARYFFSLVVAGPVIVCFGGKNSHNYAYNDTVVWKYRASDTRPVSTYREDCLRLMGQAGPNVPGCVAIEAGEGGGGPLHCHAVLLNARIPALGEQRNAPKVSRVTMQALLHYVYTSQLPPLCRAELFDVIRACHLLGLPARLKQKCEQEIVAQTTVGNVVATLAWCCREHKLGGRVGLLATACVKIIIPAFEQLRADLRQLPEEYYAAIKTQARKKQ